MAKSKEQLDLFHNDLMECWSNREDLGRLYYDIYNMKFFVYENQVQKNLKPVIQRKIKVNNENITINLRPQLVKDDEKIKYRYLTEIDQNIFDFIMYKFSQDTTYTINGHPSVLLSFDEIRTKLGYDNKRIKESLYLLTQYKIEFDSAEFEGIIANQFLESVIIRKGRNNKTLVKLSEGLKEYIIKNKYLIMNYQNLFDLNNRISRILFKRICISNIMNYGEQKKQTIFLKETICDLLAKYGIEYNSPMAKSRLFRESEDALNELKSQQIIDDFELKAIMNKHTTIDFNLNMELNKRFSNQFSINQKLKEPLKIEQQEKQK